MMRTSTRVIKACDEAVCRQAVSLFAEHLARLTELRAEVTDSEDDEPFIAGNASTTALRIQWTISAAPDAPCAECECEDDVGADTAVERTIDFYTRTMCSLASNRAAALKFIEQLAGYPRDRTRGSSDRTQTHAERSRP